MLLRHVTAGRIAFAMGVREITADRVLADVSWSGGEALHVVARDDWFSAATGRLGLAPGLA